MTVSTILGQSRTGVFRVQVGRDGDVSHTFLWSLEADKDQNACLSIEVSHFPFYLSNPALSHSVLTRQGRVGGSSSGYLLWTSNGESTLKSACPGVQRVRERDWKCFEGEQRKSEAAGRLEIQKAELSCKKDVSGERFVKLTL